MPTPTLQRIRSLIGQWPQTDERLSHGAPTFWGGRKTFAMWHSGNYDGGQVGLWIKATDGVQQALIDSDPARFYRPKYMGPKGWVGLRLTAPIDWDQLEFLLLEGYRSVAPKRALAEMAKTSESSAQLDPEHSGPKPSQGQ